MYSNGKIIKGVNLIIIMNFSGVTLTASVPGGPPAKRAHHSQQLHPKHLLEHGTAAIPVMPHSTPLNGRAVHSHMMPHGAPISRSNARKQVISWMDAPDDVYFRATDNTKSVRLHSSALHVVSNKEN